MSLTKIFTQKFQEKEIRDTDIFHVTIVFEDTFSFAKITKKTTVSGLTFKRMQNSIGTVL